MQTKHGFTLLEVLVAISLFAIVAVVTTQGMLLNLKGSQQSDARAAKYNQVVEFSENLRRQWLDPTFYASGVTKGNYRMNKACYDSPLTIPSNFTITVYDITPNPDDTYSIGNGYTLSSNCTGATYRPSGTARRVRVQSDTVSGQQAEVTFTMSGSS